MREKTKKLIIGCRDMVIAHIFECAFAEDLVVYSRNEEDLQRNLGKIIER